MKIKSKLDIHPLYYIIAFICFITGYFKAFTIYTIVLLVHELGHIIAGLILKWPIKKVIVYPFGCMTVFDQKLNSSIVEEFLILCYGPLFQILFYLIYPTPYHYFILIFNLLPIYPLDGSKFLFLFFNKFISYYYSYIIIYIISYLTLFILFCYDINFFNYLILIYLSFDVTRYVGKISSIMLKFYYERLKYPFKYSKNKIIKGSEMYKMHKEKNNYFFYDNYYHSEEEVLKKNLFLE